MAGITHML